MFRQRHLWTLLFCYLHSCITTTTTTTTNSDSDSSSSDSRSNSSPSPPFSVAAFAAAPTARQCHARSRREEECTWLHSPTTHCTLQRSGIISALAAAAAATTPPCNTGEVSVLRHLNGTDHEYSIAYKLFRPMSLSSRQAAPIVALHGGPSVPSNYLEPLVQAVPYRSILFYDQLGCGDSDEPSDPNAYSIDLAVKDLQKMLSKLGIRRYHLYGQSFGGILAYEFLKSQAEDDRDDGYDDEGCLSVILSSTPSNVKLVESEANKLVSALDSPELFRETHQCRLPDMPPALADAYAKAGTVWRGTTAISDYVAAKPSEDAKRMPSCMLLRGEHDFVTEACTADWKTLFNSRSVREKVLPGCSHHGLLENPALYGDLVDSFLKEYD